MLTSRWYGRLLAVCVLTVGLVALPTGPAVASGDDSGAQGTTEEPGLMQDLLDWLLGLVDSDSTDDENGDTGPQNDPMG